MRISLKYNLSLASFLKIKINSLILSLDLSNLTASGATSRKIIEARLTSMMMFVIERQIENTMQNFACNVTKEAHQYAYVFYTFY